VKTSSSTGAADGRARALTAVRAAHTAIWAFFAASIVLIPIATLLGQLEALGYALLID